MTETTANNATTKAAVEAMPLNLDVSVRLVEPKNNLLGFASVVLNNSIVIDDISIVRSDKGIYAGMPSKPDPTKPSGYKQTVRPFGEFRTQLHAEVAKAYHAQVDRVKAQAAAHGEYSQTPEPGKSAMQKDIDAGKKQADKENAERGGTGKGPQTQEQDTPGGNR